MIPEKENRYKKTLLCLVYFISPIIIEIAVMLLNQYSITALLLCNVAYFIGIACLAIILLKRELVKDLSVLKESSVKAVIKNILLSFAFYIISVIVAGILVSVISQLAEVNLVDANNNQLAITEMISYSAVVSAFLTCVLAPFVEEIIYRKLIFSFIAKYNGVVAVIVSSALFAFMHEYSSLISYSVSQVLINSIPYFLMGVTFCVVYKKTNNIFYSIIVHALANVFALTVSFAIGQ